VLAVRCNLDLTGGARLKDDFQTPLGRAISRRRAETRRRGSELEGALLDAAWDELNAVGYSALTMEGVAHRAGTSRPVLARRWPTRLQLVAAALRHRPVYGGEVPDTGNLRDDVLAVVRLISARLAELGPETICGALTDYFADPDLLPDLQAQLLQTGNEFMAVILQRAADRGEARTDIPPRVATLPVDLIRHELFRSLAPADERAITEVVDQVFLPLVRPLSA
jgi:AcrR family transcriptional regulator